MHKVATAWHFEHWQKRARGLSDEQLAWNVKDCGDCIAVGCDPEFYSDERSVYVQEQNRRALRGRTLAIGRAKRRAYLNR